MSTAAKADITIPPAVRLYAEQQAARAEAARAAKAAQDSPDDVEDDEDGPSVDVVDRWPRLGAAAYHGIAGEIVRAADPDTEADPVAVLLQFLVAFGNAVGRGPHWVAGATRHHLVLFAALVGPTASGRKGASWDVVRHFIQAIDDEWSRDRTVQGLSTGEGLIYHVRDAPTRTGDGPKDRGRKGKAVVDEGVADKRLLAMESELGRTFRVMSRENNTLSAVMRQAWDCAERLATLTRHNAVRATGPHVGIIGHITSDELRALLGDVESANGFGNRFLWACVKRSKCLPGGGAFYSRDWGPIAGRLREVYRVAQAVRLITRDPGAEGHWHRIYEGLSAGRPGLMGAMLARAEAQVMRLACIYALLDGVATVGLPHLMAAVAVWDYCEALTRYVFGDALADPQAEKLLAALKAAPAGMKRSAISIDVFGRHMPKPRLDGLLTEMLSDGLIYRTTASGTRGRPAELWFAGRAPGASGIPAALAEPLEPRGAKGDDKSPTIPPAGRPRRPRSRCWLPELDR